MDKLGRRLREAREAKGSTLEQAEEATHIRAHFIESLEAGDFAAFAGGDVQVRGFLRIYARYLDLSPDAVVSRYSAEVHGDEPPAIQEAETETNTPPSEPPDDLASIRFRPRDIPVRSSLPRWMSVKTVIIVGLVLTVLLAVLAVVAYVSNRPNQEMRLPLLATRAPTKIAEAPTGPAATARATPTFPVDTTGHITLTLTATEHVQVRVSLDSEVALQQTMEPGQTHSWTDNDIIIVETGNGAALQVTVNGASLGTMGERGEFCARAWTPSGEVSPP
ncbi:MAG: DUF4115 domain-containing protein [Anaerolineae bacterium]